MFTVRLGITPDKLRDMSVPQMVDHVDYLRETDEVSNGGG